MKNKNTSWFSIVMALLLTIVMVLLVLYILEYIIPYSKNVKSIENSSNAFYQAESWVEERLYHFKDRLSDAIDSNDFIDDTSVVFTSDSVSSAHDSLSMGDTIPPTWEGNSAFSGSFNIINAWNPIQLEVWWLAYTDWDDIEFIFQIPNIDRDTARDSFLPWSVAIINWQLSWNWDTLNAEWSWILTNDFSSGVLTTELFDGATSNMNSSSIQYDAWQILTGTPRDFKTFYNTNCGWSCILKMSVINELKVTGNKSIPYLEYQIDFNWNDVPLRFSRIKADWKSYWFQKSLEVRVPQQTTNQAFDFTVFQ